jgi:hypothetical protein
MKESLDVLTPILWMVFYLRALCQCARTSLLYRLLLPKFLVYLIQESTDNTILVLRILMLRLDIWLSSAFPLLKIKGTLFSEGTLNIPLFKCKVKPWDGFSLLSM